jgi:hypothetical protein
MRESQSKAFIGGKTSRAFEVSTGVHVAMKELTMGGTIIYRTKQVCAYADDIALVGRNLDWPMEMFDILEEKGMALGLRINEGKTKYMKMSSSEDRG